VFKYFGYDDCELNHQIYYALTRKYYKDPTMNPKIFFWRNNVMHGARIPLKAITSDIPLLRMN
jgi:hypothetical protein